MSNQIPITNPRIIDNQWLDEAFRGVNNSRTYNDFTISDNYWIYLSILASSGSNMQIIGDIDCSTNPNYPIGAAGDVYRVSVAGKIGGGSGFPVSAGDMVVCFIAGAAGTQAAVGANWNIKQVGLQRVFEVSLSTGDLTQTVVRDWTGTIGRNVSMVATGTWAVSGTNFSVLANGDIIAGIANGTITVGRSSQYEITHSGNTIFGVGSGKVGATGNDNTFIGNLVAQAITSGSSNVAIGAGAMYGATSASSSIAIGKYTLFSITTGQNNIAIGDHALNAQAATNNNLAIGYYAGALNQTGSGVTIVGHMAGSAQTSGDNNTFIGTGSGLGNISGYELTAVGANSLQGAMTNPTHGNVAVGSFALQICVGNYNTGIGEDAMIVLTSGIENTGLGRLVMQTLSTGSTNTALGAYAGFSTTTGSGNVFLGFKAGYYATTESNAFYLNNLDRTNLANDKALSLMYGVFAPAAVNQKLYVNAGIINFASIPVGNALLVTGDLYVDTAANILGNSDLVVARKV